MKKSIGSAIGILAISTVAAESALAFEKSNSTGNLRKGVYYHLTPQMAETLNIDFQMLLMEMNVKSNQRVLFKVLEDNQLDLSIYEDPTFNTLRADGVIRM